MISSITTAITPTVLGESRQGSSSSSAGSADRTTEARQEETRQTRAAGQVAQTTENPKGQRVEAEAAVEDLNSTFKDLRTSIQFSMDEEADQLVVKVMDTSNDEIIRQIPPEAVLAMVKFFKEMEGDTDTETLRERGGKLESKYPALEGLLVREQV